MLWRRFRVIVQVSALVLLVAPSARVFGQAQQAKPNILVIWGDDKIGRAHV